MKIKPIIVSLLFQVFFVSVFYGQAPKQTKFNDEEFKSVFTNIASGKYEGTTNGVLFLETPEGKDFILDFQGSFASLELEEDPDEVYDVSKKMYIARTTSGKTTLNYQTYGLGNELNIEYRNEVYKAGILDGACDMVIDGLSYYYKAEKEAEYLVLTVTKELKLSNYLFLLEKIDYNEAKIQDEVIKKERFITLLPHSTLVFAIKR